MKKYKITLKTTDITQQPTCAIVNAANSSLLGGGGVDGAIHRAGGSAIYDACLKIRETDYTNGLPTGEVVATTAGNMPSHYVIHTVGPIYRHHTPEEAQKLLANCYTNSLKVAKKLGCQSIAFPAISTGIYGYPKEEAAKVAYQAVVEFLRHEPDMEVVFVFFSAENEEVFRKAVGL